MKSRDKSKIGNHRRCGWLRTCEQLSVAKGEQPGVPSAGINPGGGKRLRRETSAAAELRKSRAGGATRTQRIAQRNKAQSPSFFERHRQEVIKVALSVVMPIVVAGVGWLCFTLNREVGEQKQTVAGVLRDVENIRDRTQRTEDRVERQISAQATAVESLRSKLDDVRELLSGTGRLPVTPVLQRDPLSATEYANARR